jgi:hypothetical protein
MPLRMRYGTAAVMWPTPEMRVERSSRFENAVGEYEQPTHHGRDDLLAAFAAGAQTNSESLEHRIAAHRHDRRHV